MRKPAHLHKTAHKKFEELHGIVGDKMREGDENLLAVLANSYIDYDRFHDELDDRGPVQAGDTMRRANPAWNMVKDCAKLIADLSKHFGLSPWARGDDLGKVREDGDALDEI